MNCRLGYLFGSTKSLQRWKNDCPYNFLIFYFVISCYVSIQVRFFTNPGTDFLLADEHIPPPRGVRRIRRSPLSGLLEVGHRGSRLGGVINRHVAEVQLKHAVQAKLHETASFKFCFQWQLFSWIYP